MSDLPDLSTVDVGHIVYWNILDDGGVNDFDPEEVTSSGRITSYTVYDNGVEGEIQLAAEAVDVDQNGSAPGGKFRVKSDGWFVVWVDDGANFDQYISTTGDQYARSIPYPSSLTGWWDGFPQVFGWDDGGYTAGEVDKSAMAKTIGHLTNQLSNSGAVTFNIADAGLYFYGNEDATNITWLSHHAPQENNVSFTHTSGMDIYRAVAFGVVGVGSDPAGKTGFEGIEFASTVTATELGNLDLLAAGILPDAGVSKTHENYGQFRDASNNFLSVWS